MKKDVEIVKDELIKEYIKDTFKGTNFNFENIAMDGVKVTEDCSDDYVVIMNMFNDIVIYYNDRKPETLHLEKSRITGENQWVCGSAILDK